MHQFQITQNTIKDETQEIGISAAIGHYKRTFINEEYHFVIMYDYSSLERARPTSLEVNLTQLPCEDSNEEGLWVINQIGKENLEGPSSIRIDCNQPVNNMILFIPQNQNFISRVKVYLHEKIGIENITFYYENNLNTGKFIGIQNVLENPLMPGSRCIKSWSCSKDVIEIQFEPFQFNPNTLNMMKFSCFLQYGPFNTNYNKNIFPERLTGIENRSNLRRKGQDLNWKSIEIIDRSYQKRLEKEIWSGKTKNSCPPKQRDHRANKRKSRRIEEWSLDSFGYEEKCSQNSSLDTQEEHAIYKKLKMDKMEMNSEEAKSTERDEFEKGVSEKSNRKKVMRRQKQKNFSERFAEYNSISRDSKEVKVKRDFMPKDAKSEFKPLIGLRNIGNTCYMNSVIECLIYDPKLCDSIIRNTPRQPGKLAYALQTIFERIVHGSQVPVTVLEILKSAVGITHETFRNNREKDALEFFKSLLEGLDNELTRIHTKPPYKQLRSKLSMGENLQNLSDEWFNYMKAREDSVIHDHFRGQFLTINKCKECENSRFSFDAYWDFPLAFRQADIQKGEVAIEEMLWVATKQENVLEITCADCKGETECTNQQRVWRLPKTLVFYLKRFQIVEQQEEFSKVDVKVEFPVDSLDMSPFIHEESLARSQGTKYRLFGVVAHRGTLNGGHYIAECLHPLDNNWYLFNDSYVRRIGERKRKLVSDTSILLFYIKQSDNYTLTSG